MSYNPFCEGTRIKLGFDLLSKGFDRPGLSQAYYGLIADNRQAKLLLECASFDEVDEHYNPGEEVREETEEMILEAVRVRQFSRTASTMAALQKVLNKAMADKGLTVGDAVIGKPKKTGLFASVTVQFPVSDGQTISIIFHSPDGNNMKITGEDEIIAFRWLLNKRDITVAVSPEGEKDVSLDEVGKRVSQLVEKNSQRFQTTQKALVESKKALDDLKAAVDSKQTENTALLSSLADEQTAQGVVESKISGAKTQLEKVKEYNDSLQSQLDSLLAQNAANAGKANGVDTTGGTSKEEQDAAEFETKKAAFIDELTGRGFTVNYSAGAYSLMELDGLQSKLEKVDNGYLVSVMTSADAPKDFKSATLSGLDKQIADALAWIDKKLAGMKKNEIPPYIKQAIDDPIAHQAWTLPTEEVKALSVNDYQAIESELEDKNYHTENLVLMAKRDGTAQDVDDADTILQMQYKAGSLTTELNNWRAALQAWISGVGNQDALDKAKEAVLNPVQIDNPVKVGDESVHPGVQILNDILAGSYSTSQEISDRLDEAAAALEADGKMEEQDALLNQAADYLTEILKKEAA